ncbi:MAG: fused MFS/spermidine synthase, partial [Alphaproteobacteria bacterium]|nr:fused MFS/spermidine synthase [Alphaproteobacteria bacterium]
HPDGPLGQVFKAFPFWRFNRVGVVGLGTGATACYARKGQDWIFYEIDPVVARIARDERFFTYLSDCAPAAHVVIGDARLSLQAASDGYFDLLILDAFSSDAIPIHLMTADAFAIYRRKLAPGGVILVHISNRYLDLEPVLGRITLETGFFGVVQNHEEGTNAAMLRYPSIWVAMARSPGDIAELAPDMRWEPLRGAKAALWTDDYVNVLATIRSARDRPLDVDSR